MIGRPDGVVHGSQLHERGTILWFPLGAGQKYVTEWRGRRVIEEDITVERVIVEAALPQESAKSEDIACKREFGIIAAIDLIWSAVSSGMETLEVADDKGIRLKNVSAREVSVYNSERVQIRDTIDDIKHPSLDISDPSLVRIKHGGGQKVSFGSGKNKHPFFRPSQQLYDVGGAPALEQVAYFLFVCRALNKMLFGVECNER